MNKRHRDSRMRFKEATRKEIDQQIRPELLNRELLQELSSFEWEIPQKNENENDPIIFHSATEFLEKIPDELRNEEDFWQILIKRLPQHLFPFQCAIDLIRFVPFSLREDPVFLNDFFIRDTSSFYIQLTPPEITHTLNKKWVQQQWIEHIAAIDSIPSQYVQPEYVPWELLSVNEQRTLLQYFSKNSYSLATLFSTPNAPIALVPPDQLQHSTQNHIDALIEGMEYQLGNVKNNEDDHKYEYTDILMGFLKSNAMDIHALQAGAERNGIDIHLPKERKIDILSRVWEICKEYDPATLITLAKELGCTMSEIGITQNEFREVFVNVLSLGKNNQIDILLSWLPDDEQKEWSLFFDILRQVGVYITETKQVYPLWKKAGAPTIVTASLAREMRDAIMHKSYEMEQGQDENSYKEYERSMNFFTDTQQNMIWRYIHDSQYRKDVAVTYIDRLVQAAESMGDEARSNQQNIVEQLIRMSEKNTYTRNLFDYIVLTITPELWKKLCMGSVYQDQESPFINIDKIQLRTVANELKVHAAYFDARLLKKEVLTKAEERQMLMYIRSMRNPEQRKKVIDEFREKQRKQENLIFKIPQLVRLHMEQFPDASSADVMSGLERLPGYTNIISQDRRLLLEQGVKKYVHAYKKIHTYYEQHKHEPKKLLAQCLGVSETKIVGTVELQVKSVVLHFILHDHTTFNALFPTSTEAGGIALSQSKLSDLADNIAVEKYYTHRSSMQSTIDHETRHQEDKYFFSFYEPIESAKTEILAYYMGGESESSTVYILTRQNGLYDFFKEDREHAKKSLNFREMAEVKEKWDTHKRRVKQAVHTAYAVARQGGNEAIDALAATPIHQWKRLLNHQFAAQQTSAVDKEQKAA